MKIKMNYKLIYWSIWLIGLFVIGVTMSFNTTFLSGFPGNFLFAALLSSIPFGVLAIYTKQVYENKELNPSQKNFRFSGVLGAFVLTILYALWSFSASMDDALNPAGLFLIFWIKPVFLGAIIGVSVYTVGKWYRGRG